MSLTLELNCLVLGDGPSHIFGIEIKDNKKVSDLSIQNRRAGGFSALAAVHTSSSGNVMPFSGNRRLCNIEAAVHN
jgi:hypothetical protein